MAVTNFEIAGLGLPTTVSGTCELFEGVSPGNFPEVPVAGDPSNNLFQHDQDIIVRVRWDEIPPNAIFLTGGEWRIEAIAEPVQTNGVFQASVVETGAQVSAAEFGSPYEVNLTFAAGDLVPGLYRMLLTMQWFSEPAPGGIAGPLASFCELGVIRVYEEQPGP